MVAGNGNGFAANTLSNEFASCRRSMPGIPVRTSASCLLWSKGLAVTGSALAGVAGLVELGMSGRKKPSSRPTFS